MNYKIENNLNFYELLKTDLENDSIEEDTENVCLITQTKLEPFHIKLKCNHAFNYIPLYNEIKNQKLNVNYKEIIKLNYNQIKCPYCREVQDNLIPFIDFPGVKKIKRVNKPDRYAKQFTCQHLMLSGKRVNTICGNKVYSHENFKNDKYLCKIHYKRSTKTHVAKSTKSCNAILVSGKRKGLQCKCKKIYKNNMCKRHYNIYNK
tara:strand:+ start:189 stop:803 length:615 start_codon:yes stop_codon:yes gene_type:complete